MSFNLLDPSLYDTLLLNPRVFRELVTSQEHSKKTIVIDEIQRVPALLDIVHDLISTSKRTFVLTGSSARRFKQKGVNLLAGRASVYSLYPLSMDELGDAFHLTKALERGLLPEAYFYDQDIEADEYLKAYVFTYIEKEIQQEQWVRKLEPFRRYLQIAAQMNSKIINKLKIAKQVGVQASTIESYYEILEDTLLGFRLSGYKTSVRKQVRLADKFYFVDTGIVRAIEKTLSIPMVKHSSYYGSIFETFIVMELKKFIEYNRLDWTMNYLNTKDDVEIDLVVSRPNAPPLLIEIKSAEVVADEHLKALTHLGRDLDKLHQKACPKILISKDPLSREVNGVSCWFYREMNTRLRSLQQQSISAI